MCGWLLGGLIAVEGEEGRQFACHPLIVTVHASCDTVQYCILYSLHTVCNAVQYWTGLDCGTVLRNPDMVTVLVKREREREKMLTLYCTVCFVGELILYCTVLSLGKR